MARDMDQFCAHLHDLGFRPATIVDVGVADGTIELYRHFPDPYLVLIEPIAEFEHSINAILSRYRGEAHFVAAGPENGEVRFGVSDEVAGLHNAKPTGDESAPNRIVKARRLDSLLANPQGPVLLKIDVEGFELGVIEGAPNLLNMVEVAILETRLIDVVGGTAIFSEVCTRMAQDGFEVYDILDPIARPLDGAMIMCDIAFVRADGKFRADRRYESPDQSRRHARRVLPTLRRWLKV
ncbi:FkbM family methyltransferase [Sphingopyxis sp. 2PD]|uniref:FkbM family methyltransferase n=1 Tax=Sphingopyxis sp. 2PD TaxID=2502196 RepID=UPI0010F6721A|nr:FkbM family methyltransferase [Sphingopyxis sp. 2PD]